MARRFVKPKMGEERGLAEAGSGRRLYQHHASSNDGFARLARLMAQHKGVRRFLWKGIPYNTQPLFSDHAGSY